VKIVPTPAFASVPQQPQQDPTSIAKASGVGGKAQKKGTKDKAPPTTPAPAKLPKPIPPFSLCDVVGHATNNFPKLLDVKTVVSNPFPNSNIREFHVTLPESAKKRRPLCTNHPCALC